MGFNPGLVVNGTRPERALEANRRVGGHQLDRNDPDLVPLVRPFVLVLVLESSHAE